MSHFDLRKNLIERRNIELDPDWAEHYLKYNTYEHQRPVREAHVNELADKMKDGRFRFGDIAFGLYNNKPVMVNGQHQSHAVIKSGETVPCVLEKYRCSSKMDLADLFRQFELLPRSLRDMVKAKAGGLGLIWPAYVANLVVAAATIEYGFQASRNPMQTKASSMPGISSKHSGKYALTKEQRVELLEKYIKEGDFLYRLLCIKDGETFSNKGAYRHIQRAPVAYVMFLTMRKDERDAFCFWERVRDGEQLTREMPEMKLREFLMSVNSHATPYSYRTVKPHEYIYKCILAWNSYRASVPTKLSYSPARKLLAVK